MDHKEGIIEDRIHVETIGGIFIETIIPIHIPIKTQTIIRIQTGMEIDRIMESVKLCKQCNHQRLT